MSETYTFRSIFSKPISYAKDEDPIVISKVIIPRIQRPYAQGRLGEAETKIRNSFLKDIFKYLTSEMMPSWTFILFMVLSRILKILQIKRVYLGAIRWSAAFYNSVPSSLVSS